MHGFLAAAKPQGVSSARFLARVKAALPKGAKAGHAGTLDPLAAGLLVVAVGCATRFIGLLPDSKRYEVEVSFGTETDTLDREGKEVRTAPLPGDLRERVARALPEMTGNVMQKAPKYSALKHEGRRMHELMRSGRGDSVPERVRQVRIDSMGSPRWLGEDRLVLEVACGKGAYMRSLAAELGERAGCCAHMSGLLRTECSGFSLADAVPEELVGEGGRIGPELLRDVNCALSHVRAVTLDREGSRRIALGQRLPSPEGAGEGTVRILDCDGNMLGAGEVSGGVLRPRKMLPAGARKEAVAA